MSFFRREDGYITSERSREQQHKDEVARGVTSNAEVRGVVVSGKTVIAKGTSIEGVITGSSDLIIEGNLEGEVKIDASFRVEEGGKAKATVFAKIIVIAGDVQGNMTATDKVEVLASGRLEGDVVAPRVALAEGAFFKGRVEMSGVVPSSKSKKKEEERVKEKI